MEIKKVFIGLIFLSFLLIIPSISAEVIINQQPASVYNLGDIVPLKVTLKPSTDFSGIFSMDLLCNGNQNLNFYKNGEIINSGKEQNVDASLVLSKTFLGNITGICKIEALLGTDHALTNDFHISSLININTNFTTSSFNPGDVMIIKGTAVKEDGNSVNGYIEMNVTDGNTSFFLQQGTINNGQFLVNATFPDDIKAGSYFVKLTAYERDSSNQITNTGALNGNIKINQIPTSLDIVFDNSEVVPGTNVSVKAILYDQSGVKIDSQAYLTLKDSKGKILDQTELPTDQVKEFPIAYDEAPSAWEIVAVSNKLTSNSNFNILENENATIDLINDTVLVTNIGNVPYNKTILIKVGNESLNIDVYLNVDQNQKWLITAPDGKYNVQVINDGKITGESIIDLTGSSIDIKKASSGFSLIGFPITWIFIFLILGAVAFILFKKSYPKSSVGYINLNPIKKNKDKSSIAGMDMKVYNPKSSRAEIALSIKGDNQPVSIVTLKIKNLSIKQARDSGADMVLKKIIGVAEDQKAAVYESNDTLCFIFSPLRTRTFKNENAALGVAQRIKDALDEHNHLFKQRLDFGVSIVHGEIIAKQEPECFKFMGMGNIMTKAKKIASLANNEILMGDKMTDKLRASVKTEKLKKDGMDVHSIKEVKNSEKNDKFIKGFMKRMEKDKG